MISSPLLQRLPCWALWGLIILYGLPGLLMRDPWRTTDAIHFGIAASMAQGNIHDWLVPNVYGILVHQEGPLAHWLAALLGKIWLSLGGNKQWLDDIMRLSCLLWLLAICWTLWSTTQRIALRPEMQPLDPLGLNADRSHYAKSIADCAVLCLLACLGLMVKSHQLATELPELLGISIIVLSAVRGLNRPITAGWTLGIGLSITILARGCSNGLLIFATLLISSMFHTTARFGLLHRIIRASLALILIIGIWVTTVYHLSPEGPRYLELWWNWNIQELNRYIPTSIEQALGTAINHLKTATWFFWPAWPLLTWTLWQYRQQLLNSPLRIPVASLVGGVIALLFYKGGDDSNLFALLGLTTVLAAIGLGSLKHHLVSLIDWFALFIFSLTGIVIWLGWSAILFDNPSFLVKSVKRLTPDFVAAMAPGEILLAIAVSTAWLALLVWRVQHHPKAVWRSLALSSGGATLVWLLIMTLWLPMINNSKSYRNVAYAITTTMQQHQANQTTDCIVALNVGMAQRASLSYLGPMNFKYSDSAQASNEKCPWVLSYISFPKDKAARPPQPEGSWQLVWEGRRASDKQELFQLFIEQRQ